MLSRVAERVYWTGRYIERAEDTARLINVYTHLLLDIPRKVPLTWLALLHITNTRDLFDTLYQNPDERNIIRFMLADPRNPSSILSSLALARENTRTTREIVPTEAWEQINDLYHYAKDMAASGVARGGRHEFLQTIVNASHQLHGLLAGTMSHGDAYNFVRMGHNLERTDMTSRILDVGFSDLLPHVGNSLSQEEEPTPYVNILWMSVLRSLSAYQMYRQHMQSRVNSEDVVTFLLKDAKFPRTASYCLSRLSACLGELPRNEVVLRRTTRLQRLIARANIEQLLEGGLHDFIDKLQLSLDQIHDQITATWFDYTQGNENV